MRKRGIGKNVKEDREREVRKLEIEAEEADVLLLVNALFKFS